MYKHPNHRCGLATKIDLLSFQVESLEDRTLLASDLEFDALAALIAEIADPTQAASLSTFVKNEAAALDDYADVSLPIVGTTFGQLASALPNGPANHWVSSKLDTGLNHVAAEIDELGTDATVEMIRSAVHTALDGTGLLQPLHPQIDGFAIESQDKIGWIAVETPGDDVTVTISLAFLSDDIVGITDVDFGLPSLPFFNLESDANLDVQLGVYLKQLTFGIENGSAFFDFDQDSATGDDLTIFTQVGFATPGVGSPLLTGRLGFLDLAAHDNASGLQLGLSFGAEFDQQGQPGFQTFDTAHLFGAASIDLALDLNFLGDAGSSQPDFPAIATDFVLDWHFDQGISLNAPLVDVATFGDSPSAAFERISLDLGAYVTDVMSPFVEAFQAATAPMAPIFEFLDSPTPVISDIISAVDSDIESLLDLIDELNSAIASPYQALIELGVAAVELTNFINSIDTTGPSHVIDLGRVELVGGTPSGSRGVNNGDLRFAAAAVDDLLAPRMSSLVTTNHTGQSGSFEDIFKPEKPFEYKLSFPLFEDPTEGAFHLLTGRDADLVRFDLRIQTPNDPLGDELSFDLFGIASGSLDPGTAHVDVDLTVGYDTFGIRQFAAGLGTDPADTLIGYLKNGSYVADKAGEEFSLGFTAGISAEANIPLFSGSIDGQVDLGFAVGVTSNTLVDLDNDPAKLRIPGEVDACVFELSGHFIAELDVAFRIGVDTLLGFVGVEFDESLGGTVFNFGAGGNCNDNTFEVASVVGSTLVLNMDGDPSNRDDEYIVDVVSVDHDRDGSTPNVDVMQVMANGVIWRSLGDGHSVPLVTADQISNIRAEGGQGSDRIVINHSVGQIGAELWGHLDNGDPSFDSDDLVYLGTGVANLYGGGGNDRLQGGAGTTTIYGGGGSDEIIGGTGFSFLFGELGNDRITAGRGGAFIDGGQGDDTLRAGQGLLNPTADPHVPPEVLASDGIIDVVLIGGPGNDVITSGVGETQIDGGAGVDQINWFHGHGDAVVIGGDLADNLAIVASAADDVINIAKTQDNNSLVELAVTIGGQSDTSRILVGQIEHLSVEGAAGNDTTDVHELYGTSIDRVSVNLADDAAIKSERDVTNVHGADAVMDDEGYARWDELQIRSDHVGIHPEAIIERIPLEGIIWNSDRRDLINGITTIRLNDYHNEDGPLSRGSYDVSVSNQIPDGDHASIVQDELNIRLHDGAAGETFSGSGEFFIETATVYSAAGPTNVNMGDGDDLLIVFLTEQRETTVTASGFVIEAGGYFGRLNLDAGPDNGFIQFDGGFEDDSVVGLYRPRGEVNLTLSQSQLAANSGGWIDDNNGFPIVGLPISSDPIDFVATGGQFVNVDLRGSGGFLPNLDPVRSAIAVQGTLSTAFTSVYASNHDIYVSSDAAYDGSLMGDLSQIEGNLKINAESVSGVTSSPLTVTLSDYAAIRGNRAVVILDGTGSPFANFADGAAAVGFAGPTDNTIIGWAQVDVAIDQVNILGSNHPLLRERFTLAPFMDVNVSLHANDGPDRIDALPNTLAELEIHTGRGQDYVTVTGGAGLYRNRAIQVRGDETSWDRLRLDDKTGPAAFSYADHDSFASGPTPFAVQDRVGFLHINDLHLETPTANGVLGLGDGIQPNLFPPRSRVTMPGLVDSIAAGARDNRWDIRGPGQIALNGNYWITGAESVTGGPLNDTFVFREEGFLAGNLTGAADDDGATNTISYVDRLGPVGVNLSSFTATGVGGFIGVINNYTGSRSVQDTFVGPDVDTIWHFTGTDEGYLVNPSVGGFRSEYVSFEQISAGAANDALTFYDESRLSQPIQLAANAGGAVDGVDLNAVTYGVILNMRDGSLQYVGPGGSRQLKSSVVGGDLSWAIGGQSNDILIGNSLANILFGGSGHDVLVGNAGNDLLYGETGNDMLIGGFGADSLYGGTGEDVLFDHTTSYDNSVVDLQALIASWSRNDLTYAQRVEVMRNGATPLLLNTTVFVDNTVDTLNGDDGLDWFWGSLFEQFDIDPANEIFL